ncbi:MAG: hypothetical protein EOP06_16025 [Proteobacteria bacterium]|nr:MAG: hypothetical protein EOP06_16025 [Pseudomonadota bacterium]
MSENIVPETTSASADITVDCILFDKSAGQPVSCADVVFIYGENEERVYGTTDSTGRIHAFVEVGSDEWEDFKLPHGGEWLINPNTEKFPTHYFFVPLTVKIPEDGSQITVSVDGDNQKNNAQLELYVENVFLAGKNIFIAELKRRGSEELEPGDIQAATDISSRLVNNGLAFITHKSLALIDSSEIERACKELLAESGEQDKPLKDAIPCSLCYTRYSSNPTRLQICLCCAPCIPS